MAKNENRKVYESRKVKNYRELVEYSCKEYANNIAYKYKKDYTAKKVEYIEKTYKQTGEDIKFLSTALLNLGLENKKIALIGNNRYEWCISYFAITCGNMVVVPLDKALPENEIENLLKRSGAEAIICDKKYIPEIIKSKENNIKIIISMDNIENKNEAKTKDNNKTIYEIEKLLKKGKELIENKDTKYENIKIDDETINYIAKVSGNR